MRLLSNKRSNEDDYVMRSHLSCLILPKYFRKKKRCLLPNETKNGGNFAQPSVLTESLKMFHKILVFRGTLVEEFWCTRIKTSAINHLFAVSVIGGFCRHDNATKKNLFYLLLFREENYFRSKQESVSDSINLQKFSSLFKVR